VVKISTIVTEIYKEKEYITRSLGCKDTSKMERLELLGRMQGLDISLEIIKKNM